MNRKTVKKLIIPLILLSAAVLLPAGTFSEIPGYADIRFGTDAIESFILFDSEGMLVEGMPDLDEVGDGWILQTGSSQIEFGSNQFGVIALAPYTLVRIDSVSLNSLNLFILSGAVRVRLEQELLPLIITSPIGRYTLSKAGDYLLQADDSERIIVFSGAAEVENLLDNKVQSILPEKQYSPLASIGFAIPETITAEELQNQRNSIPYSYFSQPLKAEPMRSAEFEEALPAAQREVVTPASPAEEIIPEDAGPAAIAEETAELPDDSPDQIQVEKTPVQAETAAEQPIEVQPAEIIPTVETAAETDQEEVITAEEPIIIVAEPQEEKILPPEKPAEEAKALPPTDAALPETVITADTPIDETASAAASAVREDAEPEPAVKAAAEPEETAALMREGSVETVSGEKADTEKEEAAEPVKIVVIASEAETVPVTSAAPTGEAAEEPAETVDIAADAESAEVEETAVKASAAPTGEATEEPAVEAAPVIIVPTVGKTAAETEETEPAVETASSAAEEPAVIIKALPEAEASTPELTAEAPEQPEAQPLIEIIEPAKEVISRMPVLGETAQSPGYKAGIDISESVVMPYNHEVYQNPFYNKTVISPRFKLGNLIVGLSFPIFFADNPLNSDSWYTPRGNNPYNFGFSSEAKNILNILNPFTEFEASRDFYLDLLSKVSLLHYRSADGKFSLHADSTTPVSLGTGMLVSKLKPSGDAPFIERVSLTNELNTDYVDYQLFIHDIGHAELLGARVALQPFGTDFPAEIGLYTLADFQWYPESQRILTSGVDLIVPFIHTEPLSLTGYADAGLLLLADRNGLNPDSFFSDSELYNYLIEAGINGKSNIFTFSASLGYQKGELSADYYGARYSWQRMKRFEELFDNITGGKDASAKWGLEGAIGIESQLLSMEFGYRYNFNEDFSFAWAQEDLDEIHVNFSSDFSLFWLEFGFRQHDFNIHMNDMLSMEFMDFLFNEDTTLYGSGGFRIGPVEIGMELAGVAQYQDADSSAPNTDNLLTVNGSIAITPVFSIGTKISL